MRMTFLTLAGALTLVLAGTSVAGDLRAEAPEEAIESFSVSSRADARDGMIFQAARDPGHAVAMTVAFPNLDPEDIASARVVLKRGETPIAGIPLGIVDGSRTTTFQGSGPDAGEWTSALVLVEKLDRAMLIQEFLPGKLPLGGDDLDLARPKLPPAPKPMGAGERAGKALELVIEEALLLPGPIERLLFG